MLSKKSNQNLTQIANDDVRTLSANEYAQVAGGASFLRGKVVVDATVARGPSDELAVAQYQPGKTLDDMVAASVPLVCG